MHVGWIYYPENSLPGYTGSKRSITRVTRVPVRVMARATNITKTLYSMHISGVKSDFDHFWIQLGVLGCAELKYGLRKWVYIPKIAHFSCHF